MADATVTREEFHKELNTERRITMLETMTAEIRKETAEIRKETAELRTSNEDARKDYSVQQRFNIRLIAGMLLVVALAFVGAAYNSFGVNQNLSTLTVKVERIEDRLANVETDVATLQEGQARITAALLQAGIIK